MRTILLVLSLLIFTPILGGLVIIASLLRVPWRHGGVYEWAARTWARFACAAAGARLVIHGRERMEHDEARIYVSNHVSWIEVFALAAVPAIVFDQTFSLQSCFSVFSPREVLRRRGKPLRR